jgi:hypothetical protein
VSLGDQPLMQLTGTLKTLARMANTAAAVCDLGRCVVTAEAATV